MDDASTEPPSDTPASPPVARGRRVGSLLLAVLAGLAIAATVTAWQLDRSIRDTDRWVAATSVVVSEPRQRATLGGVLADEAAEQVRCRLPAGGVAARARLAALEPALRQLLTLAIGTDTGIRLWERAQRASHAQLIDLVESGAIDDDGWMLDLLGVVEPLEQALGEFAIGEVDVRLPGSERCGSLRDVADIALLGPAAVRAAASLSGFLSSLAIAIAAFGIVAVAALGGALVAGRGAPGLRWGMLSVAMLTAGVGMLLVAASVGSQVSLLTAGIDGSGARTIATLTLEAAAVPGRRLVLLLGTGAILAAVGAGIAWLLARRGRTAPPGP